MIRSILFFGLIILNIYTFFLMGWDKSQARGGKWRIPESRFFNFSLFGGSLGVLIGMPIWRHKAQKRSFKWRIYGIILLQIFLGSFFSGYL